VQIRETYTFDYYPFGMLMPGRSYSSTAYKYGFNGKEKDDEVSGTGNQYDYGFRIYNPRIAKFLSVDPLTSKYPELSPFHFAGNSPIKFVDIDGRELSVSGTVANDFINLLSQRTGLILSQNAQGFLTYQKTDVAVLNLPEQLNTWGNSGSMQLYEQKPVLQSPNTAFVSAKLRNEVIRAINGGNGVEPVFIIARTSSELKASDPNGNDNVLFDQYPFDVPNNLRTNSMGTIANDNVVDMTDFNNCSNAPEFQAGLLGHIMSERMYPKNGQPGSLTYNPAHQAGQSTESDVMKEFDPLTTGINNNNYYNPSNLNKLINTQEITSITFDYGNNREYILGVQITSAIGAPLVRNANEVTRVIK
jgi:RHS repeat-associated protein